MAKEVQIHYLNKIKPFINLKAICEDYNKKTDIPIDYNNLRAVLNGISKTRLSNDKLDAFIDYLYQYLYVEIFDVYNTHSVSENTRLSSIISAYANKMSHELTKELENELYNKRKQQI